MIANESNELFYFSNIGSATVPVFSQVSQWTSPLFEINLSDSHASDFADLDGDGDADAIVSDMFGNLNYWQDIGSLVSILVFVGDISPGIDVGYYITPTLVDLDGDGDLDILVGDYYGRLSYLENTGSETSPAFTLRNGSANPFNGVDLGEYSAPSFVDLDGDGDLDLVVGDATGRLSYFQNNTVRGQTIQVTVLAQSEPPVLTGFGPSITFDGDIVNGAPQLLDADVNFTDGDGDSGGGTLTLSGLLAEDRVGVRNEGTGAGQIGLSGSDVTFGGVVIGTLTGGSGTTLTVTFNGAATPVAIEALIQNLTYANVSNSPTASRTLALNVTDAAGNSVGLPDFDQASNYVSGANPFAIFTFDFFAGPAFADLDGDGDLDGVVGAQYGDLRYVQNTGSATAPVFTLRTGPANPFGSVSVGYSSRPAFADLDGDGDQDLLVGEADGTLNYFLNTGSAGLPAFTPISGLANPFNGVDVGAYSLPTFVDLDGDGDLDAVVGEKDGVLNYFQNTGTSGLPVFSQLSGLANPFDGIDVGAYGAPAFADLDGDGDLDLVVGEALGKLLYFHNTGSATAPQFVQRTGGANPFNGADVGFFSTPAFADLDGDGDLDLVVGAYDRSLTYFVNNTTTYVPTITVTVLTQDEPFNVTGGPGNDLLSGGTGDDVLNGADGNDSLSGSGGADILVGGNGADLLEGGAGDDRLDGGKKTDTASYATSAGGVVVSLAVTILQDTVGAGIDLLTGIENLTGSAFSDTLTGNDGDNILTGGAGDDSLVGGKGNDALIGGDGVDTASFAGSVAGVTASLLTGKAVGAGKDTMAGIENLAGSALKDVLTGDAGANSLSGGEGNDSLDGGAGDDLLDGGNGQDLASYAAAAAGVTVTLAVAGAQNTFGSGLDTLISIEDLTGSGFNDILTGNALANLLSGGAGNDSLDGSDGTDSLLGGNGGDTLLGGLGNDNLTGGAAADILTGGAGKDRFIYLTAADSTKSATDLITDLTAQDSLDLSLIDADTITAGDQAFVRVGAFSGVAGQYSLTFDAVSGQSLLQADINGDSKADLVIAFTGDVTGMTAGWVL